MAVGRAAWEAIHQAVADTALKITGKATQASDVSKSRAERAPLGSGEAAKARSDITSYSSRQKAAEKEAGVD